MFKLLSILISLIQFIFSEASHNDAIIHLAIHRRPSSFVHHESANLTKLADFITQVEERYALTHRTIENNRLMRNWRAEEQDTVMLDKVGLDGTWYTTIDVGDPIQSLEIDLDMLSPDWYTIMTSSGRGSKYDTFLSSSHNPGENQNIHPYCHLAKDIFHLTTNNNPPILDWPICQASHSTRHTLHNSGTILGLAPHSVKTPNPLSRLSTEPSLIHQLHSKNLIAKEIWSITLLDSSTGILSLGGTLAREVEEIKVRLEVELRYLGQEVIDTEMIEEEVQGRLALLGSDIEDQFKWIDVHGSRGWWMGLIAGIWVDGVKILKNQPFLLDLSSPFIHAPQSAYRHFYNSIPGSNPIDDTFSTFPCLNPPHIALEIGGWNFRILGESTRVDGLYGPAGGRFSLGKLNDVVRAVGGGGGDDGQNVGNETDVNSGYCVGIVVGSEMGSRQEEVWKRSGMKDVWVLGEPVFRGLGIVFDSGSGNEEGKARMGFRSF